MAGILPFRFGGSAILNQQRGENSPRFRSFGVLKSLTTETTEPTEKILKTQRFHLFCAVKKVRTTKRDIKAMTPEEYEEFVRQKFVEKGYRTELTPKTSDYGIDIFAFKDKEKIGVQVKMYGHGRKINRQMIMELYGAKDYFDCTKAILATDGEVIDNAKEVAEKLGVKFYLVDPGEKLSPTKPPVQPRFQLPTPPAIQAPAQQASQNNPFDLIWTDHIKKLEGQTLKMGNGDTNQIVKVDWSGIERITSNGKTQKIKIEIFRLAIAKILSTGSITRDFINQEYPGRASSGIVLILSQVPFFDFLDNPSRIVLNKAKYSTR